MENDDRPEVLVIDDDELVRSTVIKMLEVGNFQPVEAETGYLGLHILLKDRKERRIKLVILDLLLPEFDGTKILAECKRIRKDVAVLIVSGKLDWFDFEDSDLKPDSVLQKPFDAGQLLKICKDLLGVSKHTKNVAS